jgi:hypothetical protein
MEAAELCRRCHRLAPFLFLNGNTFASVARVVLEPALSELAGAELAIYRTAIGHYVAGTISETELPPLLREANQ